MSGPPSSLPPRPPRPPCVDGLAGVAGAPILQSPWGLQPPSCDSDTSTPGAELQRRVGAGSVARGPTTAACYVPQRSASIDCV